MASSSSGNGAGAGAGAIGARARHRKQATIIHHDADATSPPASSSLASPSTLLLDPNDKADQHHRHRRRRKRSRTYMYPCVAAVAAVLVLAADMRWSAPRARARAGTRQLEKKNDAAATAAAAAAAAAGIRIGGGGGPLASGTTTPNDEKRQRHASVGGSESTPGQLTTDVHDDTKVDGEQKQQQQQQQKQGQDIPRVHVPHRYPTEVALSTSGFADGRKALKLGNRPRSHKDSEGRPLDWWTHEGRSRDNFEDLDITLLKENEFRRRIRPDRVTDLDSDVVPKIREEYADEEYMSDRYDQYEAMDDDAVRSMVYTRRNGNGECRLAEWTRLQFPTCNAFHEMIVVHSDSDNRYLGNGHFRMAFSIKEKTQPWFILKVLRWRSDADLFYSKRYEMTRMDGLVMERLSSSPRITDMYGFCATSIMTEPLPGEVWDEAVPVGRVVGRDELDDAHDVDPKNAYTPAQKLDMALEMAEALADLHGHKDGMIVHDDLDLGQYLRTPDGRIKLNDFNRAKPQLYDGIKGEYCKYYNGGIGGKFRSPEEFVPTLLNEKIDIFSLGNCFYGLLTGLWPHYLDNNDRAQEKLVRGVMPYIDKRYRQRSYPEWSLVKAIEMCHKREPEERSDIFAIVDHLRKSIEKSAEENRKVPV